MATYKVIQDIEAEDKLVGPLTLRQFIYAGITAVSMYLAFIIAARGAWFVAIFLLPVGLLTGFLAFPWGRDQPTEVWALAKVRFLFKPRRRIWDQSGIKELVTVTVPKRMERHYTNGLSETEVRSRLHALANTIDSRGWAVKNIDVNLYGQSAVIFQQPTTDRLIDPSTMPQVVPYTDINASDDMLDEANNPTASKFNAMMAQATKTRHDDIVQRLQSTEDTASSDDQPADYWFLNPASPPDTSQSHNHFHSSQVVTPNVSNIPQQTQPLNPHGDHAGESEAELLARLAREEARRSQTSKSHLRTIQPLGHRPQTEDSNRQLPSGYRMSPTVKQADDNKLQIKDTIVTATPDPAILQLASNNDLNVATLAREAKREQAPLESSADNEVIISLH